MQNGREPPFRTRSVTTTRDPEQRAALESVATHTPREADGALSNARRRRRHQYGDRRTRPIRGMRNAVAAVTALLPRPRCAFKLQRHPCRQPEMRDWAQDRVASPIYGPNLGSSVADESVGLAVHAA